MVTNRTFGRWVMFAIAIAAPAALVWADEPSSASSKADARQAATAPLRWKLKLGEKLKYRIVDELTLTTRGGPLGDRSFPTRQEMGVTWSVVGVKDDGETVIEQKIDHVQARMTGPDGKPVEFDSAGEDSTSSRAAMVAPFYQALTKGDFEFTMTARGEIKDVKVPDEVLEGLKNSPGASLLGDIATAEGLARMVAKWALVLPENAPQLGQEWSSRVKLNSPSGDEQLVESSYRFDGIKEIDGRTYAMFRPGLKMTFSETEGARTKVKEQTSGGEMLFDVEAGRLQSAVLKRDVTMDVTAADTMVEQKVKQTVEVKLVPAK